MAGASLLAIECQPTRIELRLAHRYLDGQAHDLDEALALIEQRVPRSASRVSIGLLGNAAEMLPELVRARRCTPDLVTDQTSAHDSSTAICPRAGRSREWEARARADPKRRRRARRKQSMRGARAGDARVPAAGIPTVDYGNNIRQVALRRRASTNAFDFPGFVPAYIRPLFCRGNGPFRWVALSGDRRTSTRPTPR